MATPTVATSNLQTIRNKVRRITRSLSPSILSDAEIDQYINTFVLYDFPEHLRLKNLHTTLTFYTEPYKDVYETSTDVNSPLYDFVNRYITVQPPVFVAGYQVLFSQAREQFYSIYPFINAIASIGTAGDGVTTQFSGVINVQQQVQQPYVINSTQGVVLLRDHVLFDSIDINNNGLKMKDFPINATFGNLYVPDTTPSPVFDPNNFINYLTGQFVVTFPTAPAAGQFINSQTVPTQTSIPQGMLFFDGKFVMRPVPDQVYEVNIEVFKRPSELLSNNQSPELQEWWQYISCGSAHKVFEDRMDLESIQKLMPLMKNYELLINRRTIVQQTSQRTATIYTQQTDASSAYGGGWFGTGTNGF